MIRIHWTYWNLGVVSMLALLAACVSNPAPAAPLAHGMLTAYAGGEPEIEIASQEVEYTPGPTSRGLPPSWSNAPERINAVAKIDRNA